jgi:predicted nuclease of predicted toxin-antitoxin system
MKFLVDAQLPVRLAQFLQNAGYGTIRTRDLLKHNVTPDTVINFFAWFFSYCLEPAYS